ncbi:BT4734/BF3469 family protein [Kaistella palustris]|uniref:BT4734/BF3469 family protein n=1 Tax=Kaistella palustris TaxID=493376 RepID=UPI00041D7CBA|nr:BT4734/BF3469 family protein [Kaistella palustris]
MKSTIFKNFNEVVENKDILKILEDIKTGTYRNAITYLRKSQADDKKEAAERAKKALPAFTPSATFKGGRKMEFLTNYNALIVLDIDKITPGKLSECRSVLQNNQYAFAYFTSPSGNGLKIFVKVECKKENHKESFLKLQEYFEKLLSVEIDKSGKDITRLCFFSYDPEMFLNENATVFASAAKQSLNESSGQNADSVCHSERRDGTSCEAGKTGQGISKHQSNLQADYDVLYAHCVSFTEKKESFVDGNRNNFVFQLSNNLNRKGVPESLALGYILVDYDYNTQEVMTAVKSAYNNISEFATDNFNPQNKSVTSVKSVSIKKNSGKSSATDTLALSVVEADEEEPAQIDKLENFLNNRYKFRYNEVLGKLEYRRLNGKVWKYITDFKENSILREIQKAKVRCSINSLRNLLHSDFCETYDPFKDYFENLAEYTGEKDHIEELALKLLVFVHDHLVAAAGGSLISEYAKKITSWEKLKTEKYSLNDTALDDYLISMQESLDRENEKEADENDGTDDLIIMSEISKLGVKFFDGLRNIHSSHEELFSKFRVDATGLISIVAQMKHNKPLNSGHFRSARRVFRLIADKPSVVEEALNNSKLENQEAVDFKGLHDRVKPFLIENWKRIEAFQNTKNIFDYKEFNNVKTVYAALISPSKKVNQQSLLKAYDSLQKLGRFGLKV